MAFTFDAKTARKPGPANANPAKAANPTLRTRPVSSISKISETRPDLGDPTAAEIAELTQRIRELAHCEQWSEEELAARLWEADHMAPINVRPALAALRRAVDAGLAIWPAHLTTRAQITLTELVRAPKELVVIDGGKS